MCIHALPNALRCGRTPPGQGVMVDIPKRARAGVDRSARSWDGITKVQSGMSERERHMD
jgi:hypothetical protein